MGSPLVRQQEQKVDIGIGCEFAAPIAAHGNDCQPLARSRVGERVDYLGDEIEQCADQLIYQKALLADRCRAVRATLKGATNALRSSAGAWAEPATTDSRSVNALRSIISRCRVMLPMT